MDSNSTELWKHTEELATALAETLRITNKGTSYEQRKKALDDWDRYKSFDQEPVRRSCGHFDNVNVAPGELLVLVK